MRILIADDDPICRCVLATALSEWGYEVLTAHDGSVAWELLQSKDAPRLAICDWRMPYLDGLQLCKKIRNAPRLQSIYVILLTAYAGTENIIHGLESGADDFIAKPFDREELLARLNVGKRILRLQNHLADRVDELETALKEVKTLKRLLPICSYCKKIRDDKDYWQEVETYLSTNTDARFSHGICPCCYEGVVKPELGRLVVSDQDSSDDV